MTERTELEARPSFSDELTEAEKAYFNSGGQDVSGLLKEDIYKAEVEPRREELSAPPPSSPAPAAQPTEAPLTPAATQNPAPGAPQPVATGEEVLGENDDFSFDGLQVGPDGRLRDDKGRYVPLRHLQKERERFKTARDANQALQVEHRTLQENYAKLAGRMDALQELWQKPAAAEPPKAEVAPEPVKEETPPDPEQDIFAYVRYQQGVIAKQNEVLANLNKRFEELPAKVEETKKAVQEQFTERDVVSYYRSDAESFGREKPEFFEAYRDLITKRHAALAIMGHTDPAARAAQIQREERELVNMAVEQRMRPAEFIYNYAVANGFRAAAPNPTPAPAPAAPAPAAAAPVPAPAPSGQMTEAERLQAAIAAQAATATLSGAGGVASETLSVDALAKMTDEEFAAIYSKLGKRGMRQYLGGVS